MNLGTFNSWVIADFLKYGRRRYYEQERLFNRIFSNNYLVTSCDNHYVNIKQNFLTHHMN